MFQDPLISNWNDTINQVSLTSEITVYNLLFEYETAVSFHDLRNMDLTGVVRERHTERKDTQTHVSES